MRFLLHDRMASFLLPMYALFAWPSLLMADGGAVRLLERKGPYQIAVFTAPTPLSAGPVDVSVLVQDANTLEPISDLEIAIKATQRGEHGATISHPATVEAATNKLFHAAVFDLPEAGWWELEVSVIGPLGATRTKVDLEVSEPPPPYLAMWPWVSWPVVPILLFSAHQLLVGRRPRQAAIAW